MAIFGLTIKRLRDIPGRLYNVVGTWSRMIDYLTGAWQANSVRCLPDEPLLNSAVIGCIRIIASDIAKLPICIKRRVDELWQDVADSPFGKVLNKPNYWQTRTEFFMHWLLSLLQYGNTYVLLERDARNMVNRMTVLDPRRVQVVVSYETGDIFYRVGLQSNPLAQLFNTEDVYIPADWIIHHKYLPLEHPLIGTSPLRVAALSSNTGRKVIAAHADLFTNGVVPPGVITLPEGATAAQVETMAAQWAEFRRSGRTAVLESGTKFDSIAAKSIDSQALELLKWTYTDVCVAFGVRPWKLGLEVQPLNTEQAQLSYYSDTLQILIEEMEGLLDNALALPSNLSAEFDIRMLYRMDTKGRYEAATAGVKGGWMKVNEARAMADNLPPVEGGDTPYMQQQNFSLEALNSRDTAPAPLAAAATPAPTTEPNNPEGDPAAEDAAQADSFPTQDKALQAALGSSYKGAYASTATYLEGDAVKRSGKLWRALQDTPQLPPHVSNQSTWQELGSLK